MTDSVRGRARRQQHHRGLAFDTAFLWAIGLTGLAFRHMSADQLRAPGISEPAVPGRTSGRSVRGLLAELFGVPAEPPARPALAARSASFAVQFAAIAAAAGLLLVRISGRPAWDGINTEDVGVFLAQALAHPWHRDVVLPALGWHLAWQLRAAFGPGGATLIVGGLLAVILGLAVATQARQCRVFVVTAVATGLVFTFVTATLSWAPSQRVTLGMEPGARYSTLPILLIDAAMIVSADACARRWGSRTWTVYAVASLVAVLAVGWVSDFRYPVSHNRGPAWALTANTWLHRCQQGPDKSITVTSGAWFGKAPVTTFSCSSLRR